MIIQKENPQPLARHRGNSKSSAPLYTPDQRIAQARLVRRYHISLPHAAVIANLLNMGGAENG